MHLLSVLLGVATVASAVLATPSKRQYTKARPRFGFPSDIASSGGEGGPLEKRTADPTAPRRPIVHETAETAKFKVDGKGLPDVGFDIGESYAGLLPVSNASDASELYFWYFPTTNPAGQDDITIWLNGGPGCSSLEGFLQENGPVLWQYGTYKPVPNPYSWNKLTNMIWVEQPVGTGFSRGPKTEQSEEDVARDFLGFFKNFIDTFGLHDKKIYITGESYAGYYISYIADAMLNTKDKCYYNLDSVMMYDPSTSTDTIQEQIPAVPFLDYHKNLFNLNQTFVSDVHSRADKCGYTDYMNKHLTFPPPGPFPDPPDPKAPGCDVFNDIVNAVTLVNPCFNIYQVATTCPVLWDVLGFPGSFNYLPDGASVYFNRTDVQKAINAPVGAWDECANGVLEHEKSLPPGLTVLPGVIERTKRSIISHGTLDMVLIGNGTLLMIQNMTWSGQQGFQSAPSRDFYVPAHDNPSQSTLAGAGVMGRTHTERGLTWVEVFLSGHMVPQFAPSVAFRQLEYMLGRVDSLTDPHPFTVPITSTL